MKRKLLLRCVGIMILFLIVGGFAGANSSRAVVSWDMEKTYTVKKGNFKFFAHVSSDGKNSWIYKVKAKKKNTSPESLNFPKKVQGANVTRIGADISADLAKDEDLEFYKNVFDVWVEYAHDCDGYCNAIRNVKKMTLPPTLTELDNTAFSGMRALEKVSIPDGVTKLKDETFYGCENLQEVNLPANLYEFSPYTCFAECPELDKVTLAKENKWFTLRKNVLLSKDKKKMVWAIPKKKTITVPKTVTTIDYGTFYNSQATTVRLGKNVTNLKRDCLSGLQIEKIELDKSNPVYAKDGQCIYRKKDGVLVVGIAKKAKLVISNQVRKLTGEATLCGVLTEDGRLKSLDIPASVAYLETGWNAILQVSGRVYYRRSEPPIISGNRESSYADLPIFCEVYVPKASLKVYQKWYWEQGYRDCIEKKDWHTF